MPTTNMLTLPAMKRICLFIVVLYSVTLSQAFACPAIQSIPDWNCDGKVVISVLGDSFVFGTGDTANGNKGGYVTRTQKKLSNITIHNFGVAGIRTLELLRLLGNAFDKGTKEAWKEGLRTSDIVVLDLGRNDRWLFGEPVETYRNLKKISTKIKKEITELEGAAPLVVTAVIMLPNRGSQGPWVAALNKIIFSKTTNENPSDLRFDLVSKRLLSPDQLHPTPKGYVALANVFVEYLTDELPPLMKKLRPDTDKDKINDLYESLKFFTDPALFDTDGDGKGDGDEIFTTLTNPLLVD